jgi:hypothetical protein
MYRAFFTAVENVMTYILGNTYTLGNVTIDSTGIGGSVYTSSGSNGSWASPAYTASSPYTINTTIAPSSKVSINSDGIAMEDGADIIFGNKSLKKRLDAIEARLAILDPNVKFESEWEDLKRLGDEYRALEQAIKEKMAAWDILKRE